MDADATRRGGFDADRPSSRRRRCPRRRANCARRIEGGSLGAEKRHEYVYVYAVPDCASYDLADRILASDEVARGASSRVVVSRARARARLAALRTARTRHTPTRLTMSAIASTVALGASARRAAAPAKRGDLAGKRAATIGDRLAKATEGIPKPNLPSLPKVNLPSAPKMPSIGGGKEASEGPGYTPARDGDTLYVGQGKYIKDDKAGIVSKTGRDSLYVGGFAGGEEGLQKYRDVLKEDPGAIAVAKKSGKKPRRESKEVDLSKDFGACAGGFPGGEVGLKALNATGVVATRSAPPTIGWGPPVLLLLAIGGTGYYLNGGDMSVEGVQSSLSVESLDARLSAASSLASGAKGTLDANLAPEQEAVLGEVVLGGLGVIVALSLVKSAAKKAAESAGDVAKVALLGAATAGVAGKILNIW